MSALDVNIYSKPNISCGVKEKLPRLYQRYWILASKEIFVELVKQFFFQETDITGGHLCDNLRDHIIKFVQLISYILIF